MTNDQLKSFQHYVPRFLLEYFSSEKLLWVYDRKLKKFRSQSPKSTAGEKAFYVFAQKNGELSSALEEMFSEIEGIASGIIKALVEGKKTLNEQDKVDLATFLAALYTRVPNSLKRTETMSIKMTKEIMSRAARFEDHFNRGMDEIGKKRGKPISEAQRRDIRRTFVEKDYDLHFPKEHMLQSMMGLFQEFYSIFAQMEWVIFEAPKNKSYIISDSPAYTFNVKPEGFWGSGIGILAPNCETTAIISPKLCIYLSQKHNPDYVKFVEATPKLVDNINTRTAICSSRFIVSHSEALLKRMVKRTHVDNRDDPYISIEVG